MLLLTVNYREAYNIFACNGILFNHESPIRGETFVTRKITRAVAKISLGLQDTVYLGNLSAKRDWGHAKDYVRAMYLMLQIDKPQDFVIATGKTTEVREFVRKAFAILGIEIEFKGKGIDEKGIVVNVSNDEFKNIATLKTGNIIVKVDSRYFRPTEVDLLLGNPTKAQEVLKWKTEYNIDDLIKDMVKNDLKLMKKDKFLKDGGYETLNYHE